MEENSEQIMIPSYKEAFKIWLKIGMLSFGGPAGQIAMMHRTLVEEKKWIDEQGFCMPLTTACYYQGQRPSNLQLILVG